MREAMTGIIVTLIISGLGSIAFWTYVVWDMIHVYKHNKRVEELEKEYYDHN